jgi:hypothetical protein
MEYSYVTEKSMWGANVIQQGARFCGQSEIKGAIRGSGATALVWRRRAS